MNQAKNYNAWAFQKPSTATPTSEELMRLCARYGMLAPSIHNTQPWRFRFEGKTLIVSPNHEKQLPFADPTGRNLYISLGACVENIVTAASAFNVETGVKLVPSGDKAVCKVEFPDTVSSYMQSTEAALSLMTSRFSNKKPYLAKKIPASLRKKLDSLSVGVAEVKVFDDKGSVRRVADLHGEATRSYRTHKEFKKELTQHIKFPGTKAFTGMPGSAMGFNAFEVALGKLAIPNVPKIIEKVAEADKQKILSSGGVCFIDTPSDKPGDWVEAGRLYEKVSLELQAEGVHSTTLAAMIEVENIRTKAAREFNIKGLPQMFLRFGYSDAPVAHTPRGPVEMHIDD